MKIVLLSMNFAPELTGIGKYSGEMADGLIDRGHEVCVVCAPPYYPAWSVHDGHHANRYVTEHPRPGLTVMRCPIWIPKRLGGLARLLHLASFAVSSLPVMLRLVTWKPDLVFAVAPGLFGAPVAWLSARLAGARAWLHIQDFEVDAAFELGLLKGRAARRAVLAVERFLLDRFDVVSTISHRMVRQLVSKGVPLNRTELLQNWVDVRALRPTTGSPALRERLGIAPEAVVCLFSGTINRKQGVGLLVDAARRLEDRGDIVFVICGDGEMRPEIESSVGSLSNVRLLDLQPAADLNALLNMADVHLLPQLKGVADLVLPSKLGGMLASGRPVVASVAPASAVACVVSGRGLVVEPECADAFVRAVVELADDPHIRGFYGQSARKYAERVLDANAVFETLERRMELVCAPTIPAVGFGAQRDA